MLLDKPLRHGEAHEVLQRSIELDPSDPTEQFNLATSDYQLQQYGEAERLLRQVLLVMPGDTRVTSQLTDVLLARGDFAGAIPLLNQLAAAAPDGPEPMRPRRGAATGRADG